VGTALLVEYFNELPNARDEDRQVSRKRMHAAVEKFKQQVAGRYNEGTLQRLLEAPDARSRRAAAVALGHLGSMKSNANVAALLTDEDAAVRRAAVDALWSLWFRADGEARGQELRRVQQMADGDKKRAAFDALIQKAPGFAEAYNQRAILFYQMGELQKAIADCERVLKLNPYHFGAQVGMARCYLGLDKPRAALKAYRSAYRLYPRMDGIEDRIRELESALGEEGKKNEDR
jgi:tetratricopeptide (TPR) repeat protein